jgi:O-antigen/teichoic acid export membrane protein
VFAANGMVRSAVATTHHVRSVVVLPGLVACAFLLARPTLVAMLLVYVAIAALLILAVAGPARRCVTLVGRGIPGTTVRAALAAGVALLTVDVALFVVGRGDVWLAAAVFEATDAAHYSTASTLAFQVCVVDGLASLTMTPIAARMWATGQRDELLRLLSAVTTLVAAATAVAVLGLVVLGDLVLSVAYGPDFTAAYGVLVLLGLGGLVKVAFGMNVTLLIAMGRLRSAAGVALLVLAVTVPIAVLGAVLVGPVGLAVGTAVAAVALPTGQWLLARHALAGIPGAAAPRVRLDVRGALREVRAVRPAPGAG